MPLRKRVRRIKQTFQFGIHPQVVGKTLTAKILHYITIAGLKYYLLSWIVIGVGCTIQEVQQACNKLVSVGLLRVFGETPFYELPRGL